MKEIPLTKGYVALVDDDDYEELSKHKWYLLPNSRGKLYAGRKSEDNHNIRMHRDIMNVTDPKVQVDHRDNNGLNNQRYNLRPATHGQNQQNQSVFKSNKLGVKGVCINRGRFQAQITYNGTHIWLGRYLTVEEASEAYQKKAKELFGEFAYG